MIVQAEVSLYPLRRRDLAGAIHPFVNRLRESGLEATMGRMSTLVVGESADVFRALAEAYETAAAGGDAALIVKVSSASPWSDPE